MFFFLSKILDVLLEPFVWAAILVALAIPWSRKRARRWSRRRAFGIAGLAILYLASLEPVANALFGALEREEPDTFRADVTYDAVILLGGVTDELVEARTGRIALNDNVERLTVTHELLAQDHAHFAILSGGVMDPALAEYGEARSLSRQLRAWGIDASRLIDEEKSLNTRENAVYSAAIVRERHFERVLVVTSAFHMRRAAECFRAVGLPVDTLRADYRANGRVSFLPRSRSLAMTSAALREMFGRLVYRVQGYGRAR